MTLAVALSGGMDSLLALALARDAGGDVLAVHAHFLPPDHRARELAHALETLCRGLGVPFHALDLSEAFRQRVVTPFAQAYASGLTPNPCAACNRDMKFGLLFEAARALGAGRIATGHYARLAPAPEGGQALLRGADPAKDQSYFLTLVHRRNLDHARFPLGDWTKARVPAELARRGLTPPLPSESQEVCFVPDDDYRAFLQSLGAPLPGPGPIVLEDGRVVGRHQGLWRYTVGQRKGIGVAWGFPLHVLAKRAGKNALVVGPKAALAALECRVREVNALADPSRWPGEVLVQTCYRQHPRPARAAPDGEGGLLLHFLDPVERPTPGQVAALFDGSGRALAGGIIA
ncbi:tRNA-specific 2-thiouridylase MnmA [Fundidesulfovibrio magnetotacticus]|uniref:tRNA-specific 2-thiouridylase MnmA n=1 Tax=Fundidesulfovibrio magnetotacticus TaxID=2730080 RepID=A0A6V8LVW7_9BACT|nr:tRNA 2-thiouridine(34) synthase MnmA [Fundidesulfovibrio magnetotacticus]GFK92405.1 tRNA-specific 2-thiouridylase MnmA [Fundidesulfovibrio magnetotacticus]